MNHNSTHIIFNSVSIPQILENLAPCKYTIGIFAQQYQKFKFLGGKMDRRAIYRNRVGGKIDLQSADCQQIPFPSGRVR